MHFQLISYITTQYHRALTAANSYIFRNLTKFDQLQTDQSDHHICHQQLDKVYLLVLKKKIK